MHIIISKNYLIGTIKVVSSYAHVLFDSGATHSFISTGFTKKAGMEPVPLNFEIGVSIPNGGIIMVSMICPSCTLSIGNHEFSSDLMVLEMEEFDIILGMDWLASYHATVDCFGKRVVF